MSDTVAGKKEGSGVFDEFLGGGAGGEKPFEVSSSRPPRVSFERNTGEKISIPYARLRQVRLFNRDIFIVVGEHTIQIKGDRLRPLYEALHQEVVVRVVQSEPETDFIADNEPSKTTRVRDLHWPDDMVFAG